MDRRHLARFALILAIAAPYGCRGPESAPAGGEVDPVDVDVLVYVLDACRPDRMGYEGYELPTSPALDRLAADPDAVVYRRHYVAGNWTKTSTASLFTGLHPYQHGVTTGHVPVEGRRYSTQTLPDEARTLAELLQEEGHATYGLVTSPHLSAEYGFDQGFDVWDDPERLRVGDVGRLDRLMEYISEDDAPYFAYVHQNACHQPFPPEHRDAEFMEAFGVDYDEDGRAAQGVDFTTSQISREVNAGRITLTPEDRRFLSRIYDAKLRAVDRTVVAPLIEGLRSLGRWDRTLLIVTADHGEELGEHGGYAHGHALWEEVVEVPLIVKFPAGLRPDAVPAEVLRPTSNIDLLPSILDFVGLEVPQGLPGRTLFASPGHRLVYSQGQDDHWMGLFDGYKLIVGPGTEQLFDLGVDPAEEHDLALAEPERVLQIRSYVDSLRRAFPRGSAPQVETVLDQQTIDDLRRLGYLD